MSTGLARRVGAETTCLGRAAARLPGHLAPRLRLGHAAARSPAPGPSASAPAWACDRKVACSVDPTTKRATASLDLPDLVKQKPVSPDTTRALPLPAALAAAALSYSRGELVVRCIF